MFRLLSVISLILLVPIIPFLMLHEPMQRWVHGLGASGLGPWTIAMAVIGLLATDVFLPVPSSLVSTLAGGQLPTGLAVLASWIGLNLGAIVGFAASRTWGRSLAERLAGDAELRRIEPMSHRYATSALVLTRALPILAEATVLLLGVQRISWQRFLPPVLLSNLGIAVAYSALGRVASQHEWLPFALSVSVALPLLATWVMRRRLAIAHPR